MSLSVPAGGQGVISLTADAENGFSSSVSVQIAGLPAGVTANPADLQLTPGTPQQITFLAVTGASLGTSKIQFLGTSGTLSHSVSINLSLFQLANLASRTKFVRTDAVTEFYLGLNTHWVVFNPETSRFFVTDPLSNQVMVLDSASETQVGTIAVPGAFGIDDTPDHTTVYVGTLVGDVYAIDPVAMQVKRRYPAASIGPYGYEAISVQVLADGRLALLGAQGGIPSVDGSSSIAIWNPVDNSITIYGNLVRGTYNSVPSLPNCVGNIGGFTRTGDRTAILEGSIDSDGSICSLNPSTGQAAGIALGGFVGVKLVASPNGRYVAVAMYPNQVGIYDAHSLNQIAVFNVAGETGSDSDFIFSADSTTLFVPNASYVYAYSLSTFQQIGWIPNFSVNYISGGFAVGPSDNPFLQAVDGTGLLAGPLEEGFGFIDASVLETGAVGASFGGAYLNPATGPTSGGTGTQWDVSAATESEAEVLFGKNAAQLNSWTNGFINVTTPPGPAGPVDIYVFAADGGMQIVADGFSYGPTILEVTPDSSTAEGGGTGIVYGYGFLPNNATTLPSNVTVTVGGKPALITGFNPQAYNLLSPPFLLQALYFTVPPGAPGTADITVTSASGTATAPGAFTYLPGTRQFPLSGSELAQGIYDPTRDVFYFTDAARIQVFSLTQGKWLSPIPIPAPAGVSQRLWGISLSPDGSKLAVADAMAGVVCLLDPDNPGSVKTFPVIPAHGAPGFIFNPAGVAVSNAGIVYLTEYVQGGTGASQYFALDTNTGVLTDFQITGPGAALGDLYMRTVLSLDGTRVYFNGRGNVFSMDTATGQIFHASSGIGIDYDLTLSSNQTQFEAASCLYDSNLDALAPLVLNDRESLDIAYVYGNKLSPDGSLLFQPDSNGMDVFDGHLGKLRTRIALPFALSQNYDALVSDGRDNILLAITGAAGNAIAVLDLSSLPEPSPLPYTTAVTSQLGSQRTANSVPSGAPAPDGARGAQTDPRRMLRRVVPHLTRATSTRPL